jgi:aryl-alcohol dehydrogenase-like predicted oxidoreductase
MGAETLALGGDLVVRRIGFGAMRIASADSPDAARALLRRALELGVNLIDTADSYGPARSERLIAESLHPYPRDLVIATKGGQVRDGHGRASPDGRPEHLREACEASLQRLRLERIDLYQLHSVDPNVPLEESLGALAELRSEGKVRHIGVSNVFGEQLRRALSAASVASVQNRYNLMERRAEEGVRTCEQKGVAFIPWSPLGTGSLARPHPALDRIARGHAATPAQIALSWLLHRSPVTIPIPGTVSVRHLEQNVRAARLRLADDEMAELESARFGGA